MEILESRDERVGVVNGEWKVVILINIKGNDRLVTKFDGEFGDLKSVVGDL